MKQDKINCKYMGTGQVTDKCAVDLRSLGSEITGQLRLEPEYACFLFVLFVCFFVCFFSLSLSDGNLGKVLCLREQCLNLSVVLT